MHFEVNDIEDSSLTWPPPDPDRMPRATRKKENENPFTYGEGNDEQNASVEAFKRRQQKDLERWAHTSDVHRMRPFYKRYDRRATDENQSDLDASANGSESGEEGWRNAEGERLRDFGVDEEVEFYDNIQTSKGNAYEHSDGNDDDVPLGELLRRRKKTNQANISEQ